MGSNSGDVQGVLSAPVGLSGIIGPSPVTAPAPPRHVRPHVVLYILQGRATDHPKGAQMNRQRPPHFPHRRRMANPDGLESLEDRLEARSRQRMAAGRDRLEALTDADKEEINRQVALERAKLEAAATAHLERLLEEFQRALISWTLEERRRQADRDLQAEIAAEAAANR